MLLLQCCGTFTATSRQENVSNMITPEYPGHQQQYSGKVDKERNLRVFQGISNNTLKQTVTHSAALSIRVWHELVRGRGSVVQKKLSLSYLSFRSARASPFHRPASPGTVRNHQSFFFLKHTRKSLALVRIFTITYTVIITFDFSHFTFNFHSTSHKI